MVPALNSTSYAILGLLALKPWTTYELAQQMDRALGQFWPRAESRIYEEPKKLVACGLAVGNVGDGRQTPANRVLHHREGPARPGGMGPDPGFRSRARIRTTHQGVLCRTRNQSGSARHARRSPGREQTATRRQCPRPSGVSRRERSFSRATPVASPRRPVLTRLSSHG